MDGPALHIEKLGEDGEIVKMSMNADVDVTAAIPKLAKAIMSCFKADQYKIILNIGQIKFPSASFIAFLIEMTSQARRSGGDIKLINIETSAKNNITTFNPLNYLSMEADESFALEDFGIVAPYQKPISVEEPVDAEANFELPSIDQSIPKPSVRAIPPETEFNIKETVPEPPLPTLPKRVPLNPSAQPKQPVGAKRSAIPTEPKKREPLKSAKSSKATRPPEKESNCDDPPPPQDVKIIRNSKSKGYRIRVKSKNESLYTICDFVTGLAKKAGFSEREVGKIKVTIYEACLNVIEHAYHSDPDEWIVVTVQIKKSELIIMIQDWGESFNFNASKSYDVEQAMQDRRTGGFGIYIIKRSMDDVSYKTDPINGNQLILKKNIPHRA